MVAMRYTCLKRSYVLLLFTAPGETVPIAEEMAARDALRRLWCPSHLPFDRKTQRSDEDNSVGSRKIIQKQRT